MFHLSRTVRAALGLALLATTTAVVSAAVSSATVPASAVAGVPRPDHVVIVVFENKKASSIFGNSKAPYLNSLASSGAKFTQSFAIEHPSEPNYLDLFSGGNQGVTDDSCPHTFSTDNLGAELTAAGLSFGGYSEGLPSVGSTTCSSGRYARKHNPWSDFTNVPAKVNMPFTSFPSDFSTLPTVSWVVPNLCNDMHDCSVATGDTWAKTKIDAYAQWAKTHNSLLIVTFDEDDSSATNNIATLFYGQQVRTGTYTEHINHYNVLRTVEDMYGLPHAGNAATATPVTDVWTASAAAASR
jgi:phospholipase C